MPGPSERWTPRGAGVVSVRLRLRPIVDRVASFSARPLDRAFRRVFERDVAVRSVDQAERLLAEVSARDAPSSRVGAWVALAASLRPLLMRLATRAQRAERVARFSSAGRLAAWSVTGSIAVGRVVEATRAGVDELQVMAAYLTSRVRDRGQVPAPHAVELATLSLYTRPGGPLDLTWTRRAAVSAAARRWVLLALRPESEDGRRRRMRIRLQAIADLPDHELRRLVDVIPATIWGDEGVR